MKQPGANSQTAAGQGGFGGGQGISCWEEPPFQFLSLSLLLEHQLYSSRENRAGGKLL
jgi:hypothetical protein